MRLLYLWISLLVVPAALTAQGGLDVNDVSFLFAKRKAFSIPYPEISAGDTGSPLLPDFTLEDLVRHVEAQDFPTRAGAGSATSRLTLHANARQAAHWYVQGVRVDDCASNDGRHAPLEPKSTECDFQLRLVLQPVEIMTDDNSGHLLLGRLVGNARGDDPEESPNTGDAVTTDNALHLIYSIPDSGERRRIVESLVRIKGLSPIPTTGKALGAHPGLLEELRRGTGTALAGAITELLTRHARAEHLKKITFFGPTPRVWVFVGGRVIRRDGRLHWEATAMPNVGGSSFQVATTNFSGPSVPSPTPLNPAAVSREKYRPGLPFEGEEGHVAKEERVHSLAAALNPIRIHAENVDCLTCHLSGLDLSHVTDSLNRVKLADYLSSPQWYAAPRGVTPFLSFAKEILTGYTQVSTWNLRAFGYFFGTPTVSFRTLTESMRVAASLNEYLQNKGSDLSCKTSESYAEALESLAASHTYAEEEGMIRACR